MPRRTVGLLLSAVGLFATACGGDVKPPAGLTYSVVDAVYTKGAAVSPNAPSVKGRVDGYSIAPPLPPGLSLDASTGEISGAPTEVAPKRTYQVTAANVGGATSCSISITVNDVAPFALAYAESAATYPVRVPIADNTPTSAGGPVQAYRVAPPLPPGLSLDDRTGVITGTPTTASPAASYVITASNSGGETTTVLSIAVTTLAELGQAAVTGDEAASTPFARYIQLSGRHFDRLQSASFEIASRPGAISRPFTAKIDASYLRRRNLLDSDTQMRLPVFGLYAGTSNVVTLVLNYSDESSSTLSTTVQADPWVDPGGIYDSPTLAKRRTADDDLGFDYFWIKGFHVAPVLLDTDGNVRWAATNYPYSTAWSGVLFHEGSLFSGFDQLARYELDGTLSLFPIEAPESYTFHHDVSAGKVGVLVEVDQSPLIESTLLELTQDGKVIKKWSMGDIFRQEMTASGDDPSSFVRDGVDWFHMNSAAYVPEDDSLLVSSRESFVVKLDYETGRIKWLFGDPTKHWYQDYPSLRRLAVTLPPGGLYPIGQHSVSSPAPGEVLVFDNGTPSLSNPAGTSAGESRPYSAASRFAIDDGSRTAVQVWRYDADQRITSSYCSSVFEAGPDRYLINYSMASEAGGPRRAEMVGLSPNGSPAFDFQFATTNCDTSFHAKPVREIVLK